jgi:hypothetical protein
MSAAITIAAWVLLLGWLVLSLIRDERARRRALREDWRHEWPIYRDQDPRRR